MHLEEDQKFKVSVHSPFSYSQRFMENPEGMSTDLCGGKADTQIVTLVANEQWIKNCCLGYILGGSTPPCISHLGHLEGKQTHLGDSLSMLINHLLPGMILQVGNYATQLCGRCNKPL